MPKPVVLVGTFVGMMMDGEVPSNPPGTWGGSGEPFPGWGLPGNPLPQPPFPPDIWGGANRPFPTPPIANAPGIPGYNPIPPWIWGGSNRPFPTPPIANAPGIPGYNPPVNPPTGGMPGQLPSSDPEGSRWVYAYVPGYGWMWCFVPSVPDKPTEPPTEPPA